jgi:putative NIF3 family GTP cyclohydrolase 1 type 2
VGKPQRFEHVPEVRLEMVARQWQVSGVIRAMIAAHPYEEVAYDIVPTENASTQYGQGVIGTLERSVRLDGFLTHVKKRLHVRSLRYTADRATRIQRIAACGGSGSDLTGEAIRQGADAFVTADVKYHAFHEAAGRIALIDAGHYETEFPVVSAIVKKLKSAMKSMERRIPVHAAAISTNPITYV